MLLACEEFCLLFPKLSKFCPNSRCTYSWNSSFTLMKRNACHFFSHQPHFFILFYFFISLYKLFLALSFTLYSWRTRVSSHPLVSPSPTNPYPNLLLSSLLLVLVPLSFLFLFCSFNCLYLLCILYIHLCKHAD